MDINVSVLIGKSYGDAITFSHKNELVLRIIREDDISYMVTCDLRFNRLNISIDNGIITTASIG
jgi:hypothetical protein